MRQYSYLKTCTILVLSFFVMGGLLFTPGSLAAGGKAAAKAAAKAKAPAPAPAPKGSAACLSCHGPFEKLASAPPFFVAPSGEKINPHVYVPHDLKEVPDCVSCHKPHSANPTDAELASLPKPTVTSCFECHHKQNFENCQKCHEKK